MMTKRSIWIGICTILCFGCCNLSAQYGAYSRLSYEEIQALLNKATLKKDLRGQADAWYQWANYLESRSGSSPQSFDYFEKSINLFQKAKDSLGYHCARADYADRLVLIGDTEAALEMQNKALEYFKAKNQVQLETQLLTRIVQTYRVKQNKQEEQKYRYLFYQKNQQLRDTALIVSMELDDSDNFRHKVEYEKATAFALMALKRAQSIDHQGFINRALYSLGHLNKLNRNYNVAIDYLIKAEQRLPPNESLLRRQIYRDFSEVYFAANRPSEAYSYLKRCTEISDSLTLWSQEGSMKMAAIEYGSDEKERRINFLSDKNKTAQKEAEIQSQRFNFLVILLCLLLVLGYILYRGYRRERLIAVQEAEIDKQKIREIEDNRQIENMQSMLAGQEDERQRVAYDLHDSLGGLLATSKLALEQLSATFPNIGESGQFKKIRALVDSTVTEVRQISRNLQPNLKFGLETALRDLVNLLQNDGQPEISFHGVGDFSRLDQTTMLHCYRIVQELLQNSIKYAKANEILVQITQNDGQITLLVEDDGAGFDMQTISRGMGINNIEHRTQFLKGEVSIHAKPGEGTSIMVTVPFDGGLVLGE
jgi:signal transduction histidine kinase